jgi:hypothetical protein
MEEADDDEDEYERSKFDSNVDGLQETSAVRKGLGEEGLFHDVRNG